MTAPATTEVDEDRLFRKISLRVLPVLMIGFLLCYIDRVNIGFAKDQMISDLGFSDAVYGFGAGIFFVGYFLFEVPSNMIMHRVGARRWIARIMITWGILSALMFLVHSPTQFYVMRFLLGAAEAGFIPGAIYYMSQWYPALRRGRAWGTFYLALAASGLVGGPVAGLILTFAPSGGALSGWHWLLIIEGAATMLLGVYILFRLPDRFAEVSWLSDAEKAHLEAALTAESQAKPKLRLGALLTNGRLWLLVVIYFVYNCSLYATSFWLPTLVETAGVHGSLSIGFVSAVPSLCAAISMLVFGYTSDRTGDRRNHLIVAFLMATVGLAMSVIWQDSLLGIVGLSLAYMGTLSIPPIFWNLPTAMLTGIVAAAGIAMINSFGNLAGFAAPYLVGYVKTATGSTGAALNVIAGLMLVGAILVATIRRRSLTSADVE
ncbi:MFS transporter [Nocardia sp. CA2R105]|uniref:MFS transporter n=1 Tax=Nocardia coffeae TaxID=2873381 RepID=UPI001CA6BA8A|nr:MFS transporter [Nocardia coffeae]MBY8858538.1 MFS transporter [Nocardia coffeae]